MSFRFLALFLALPLFVASCRTLERLEPEEPGGGGTTTVSVPPGSDVEPLGAMAQTLLRSGVRRAVLEIDTADGVELAGEAQQALAEALREHGQKTDVDTTASGGLPSQDVYTTGDLVRISLEHRNTETTSDHVSIHVLVLPGRFEREQAVGVAFEATSFAVFPEQIRSGLLSSVSPARFETAVAVHELGHLFGLVDITGEGAFHEDPDHTNHSRNEDSVMHWAVEDVSIGNVFGGGGPPTTFDEDDRREMERIRE